MPHVVAQLQSNNINENVPHDVTHGVPHGDLAIIIELIKKNSNVTREEMAMSINKTIKTVQRIINRCEYIEYVRSGDKGHWASLFFIFLNYL